jgi:hypothetical protein
MASEDSERLLCQAHIVLRTVRSLHLAKPRQGKRTQGRFRDVPTSRITPQPRTVHPTLTNPAFPGPARDRSSGSVNRRPLMQGFFTDRRSNDPSFLGVISTTSPPITKGSVAMHGGPAFSQQSSPSRLEPVRFLSEVQTHQRAPGESFFMEGLLHSGDRSLLPRLSARKRRTPTSNQGCGNQCHKALRRGVARMKSVLGAGRILRGKRGRDEPMHGCPKS